MPRLRLFSVLAITMATLFTTSCSTLGIGQPDQATRWLADIACVTAVTQAIGEVSGDPSVGGAKTVLDVVNVINKVGTSNVPATVLSACKDTISHLGEDAAGAAALLKGAPGTDQPKAQIMKMATAPRLQPKAPQPVVVPIPRK